MTVRNKVISILVSLLVAVTFMPVTGHVAFAEETVELQSTFSVSGKVSGLVQSGAAYNNVTIKWSAYKGAAGYEIYRADKKTGKYKKIRTQTGCSYKDKGNKKLGKKKYYKVRAYATVGSVRKYSAYSSILSAKPKVGKPAGLTSTGSSGQVTLKWKKVSGATGYQVYRATSKNGKYTRLGTTKKKQYYNTSLTKGKKYFYKVRAYKKYHGKKYGSFTAPIEGMTTPAGPGGFSVAVSADGTVTGKWSKVAGASGYQLQRATAEKGPYTTVGESTTAVKTDKLTESGQYYYRVRAFSTVNGKRQYGSFSSGGRSGALQQAKSWVGSKESNGSHKKIIDVYNNYGPKYGRIGYSASWCAAFVSAVAIKTNNTSVIPVDCYCPRMLNNFAKTSRNKSYTPKGGDVVFFDWNFNRVPDHVGMVESVSGKSITTIEGNYSDAVKRRTFKKGYSLLLAYGLPNYTVSNIVSFTAPPPEPEEEPEDEVLNEADVTQNDIQQVCDEITAGTEPEAQVTEAAEQEAAAPAEEVTETPAQEDVTEAAAADEETVAAAAEAAGEAGAAEEAESAEAAEPVSEAAQQVQEEAENAPLTETETAEKIIEYIQEETPAADAAAEESTFNAFLVYGVCDEMDIDACVVTVTDTDGSVSAYNEVVLDGELYVLNATEDGGILEKYTPEEIN